MFAVRFRNIAFFIGVVLALNVADDAASQTGGAVPDGYVINSGDELELDILDDSEAPQRFTVGGDGNVQLPFIGRLQVATLTVGVARDLVRQTYIDREIFVDPGVELSVASFRPVSVLGDVREPGNFDYQPYMTAEQAVGLAGGPAVSANNEEARVLERRTLEGALSSMQYDLALASARLARVSAQLEGRETMEWTDLPKDLREAINRELFDEQKPDEDRIVAIDLRNFTERRALLEDSVAEAAKRAELLDQREAVLVEQLDTARSELDRATELTQRGLVTRAQLTAAKNVAAEAESALLQLREQRSGAIVQSTELKRELSQFDADRERDLRTQAQEFDNEVRKLIATRQSLEDRLQLLQQWMNAANSLDAELLIGYQVRRRAVTGVITQEIGPYETLLPGDTLVITVKPPEGLGRLQ